MPMPHDQTRPDPAHIAALFAAMNRRRARSGRIATLAAAALIVTLLAALVGMAAANTQHRLAATLATAAAMRGM